MRFQESLEIAAEPERLFDLSQDYARRLQWDPFLREARLLGGATEPGLGVVARCTAHNGMSMETRYVSFQPPRTCAVEMTRGPRAFGSFAASWRFEPTESGKTRVSFTYHLIGRPVILTGWIGWIFARETRRRLAALKRASELG
jgi:ribosome-associated toxin RatA of RatAB toxin-antitoxin module